MIKRKGFTHLIMILLLISRVASYSQNQRNVDSLILLVKTTPDDSNKVNLYYSLSRQYDVFKSKENIEWNLTALDLSKKINFSRGIKRHYADIIRFLFQRGVYDLAIAYYHDYENYLIENNFNDELLASYNMYGNLLSRQNKRTEALKYYHKARAFQLLRKDYPNYANVLNNISIVCLDIGQYDSALVYCSIAISIFKKNNSNSALANSILGIGEIYLKKGDLKNAESKVFESMDIYQAVNEIHGLCNCNYVLGQIYLQAGRYDEAIIATNKALRSAKELHFLDIERNCFNNLSQIYHLLNNDTEAYKNHVLYKSVSDSLAAENLQGKMLEMEVKYDISKKEGQLKEQQFEIDSKNKQRNYLVLIVLVILILFFISFRAYSQKKKANAIIFEQKKLVEEKQQEVMDSIRYAKRIQESLLPKEKYMQKVMNKLKGL
jgi:tetratricopeptide (TPR) repeat protein